MQSGEKVLITGASGFIGSHLADRLEGKGLDVKRLTREEFSNFEKMRDLLKDYEYIFNLAAYGSQRGEKDPWQTVVANLIIPLHLLQGNPKTKATIFCGSSSEYGFSPHAMVETQPLHPNTIYAGTKAAMSVFIEGAVNETGYPVAIARPFTIYGPNEKETRLIPTIIRSCLTGEEMKLDDSANHDWIYVEDLVDGLILMAEEIQSIKGNVVNFGSGTQLTNRQIVEIIEELIGRKANITGVFPRSKVDSRLWQADTTRATVLGWKSKTSIVKGIQKTIDFYEKKYKKVN